MNKKSRDEDLELHESTQQLAEAAWRSVIENTSDTLTVINRKGKILFINRARPGYTVGQHMGTSIFDWAHPRGREPLRRMLEQVFTKGTSVSEEMMGVGRDGADNWYLTKMSPIAHKGRVRAALMFSINIHRRKVVERKLTEYTKNLKRTVKERTRELERRLHEEEREKAKDEALLASIGEGVIAVDDEFRVMYSNEHADEMLGWQRGEMLGKKISDVLPVRNELGKNVAAHRRPIQRAVSAGEKVVTSDLSYVRSDGSTFPVVVTASPVLLRGKLIGAISVFRDIFKEKMLDRAKSEFVSLASHQLRTPLAIINWYTEKLFNEYGGVMGGEQRRYLNELFHANQRMIDLVNALLNVSRIELGTLLVRPESIHVPTMADSILGELLPSIQKKELTIVRNYEAGLQPLHADPQLLRIVFQNVLVNAVKYTPERGTIKVSITANKPNVCITVADSGLGIPRSQQGQIFTKLFRADNVREIDADGTGLGLYIVKSIVEQSGGRIWFESEENKGAIFYIVIPEKGQVKSLGKQLVS